MPTSPNTFQLLGRQILTMSWIAHFVLVIGLGALAVTWFLPSLLGAPDAAANCPQVTAKATGAAMRIVDIKPADFRRGDVLCVTVENVVTADEQRRAKEAVDKAKTVLDDAAAKKAEAEAEIAPVRTTPLDTARAKLALDVRNAQLEGARRDWDARNAEQKALTAKRHYFLYFNGSKSPFAADAVAKPDQQVLAFNLNDSTDASNELAKFWRGVLTRPISNGKVKATLALGDGSDVSVPYATDEKVVNRVVAYGAFVRWLSLIALLAGFVWLVTLATTTPLLRAGDTLSTGYSLARVQMLFWFLLITGGYLYISFVAGQWMNVMNGATLALLGISGAATGAALTVDSNRPRDATGALPPPPPASGSFLRDIASDGNNNIQLPRVQMIMWTLILGGILIWTVATKLEFPNFDGSLLALAGIVNGVYVALKTQEPQPPADKKDEDADDNDEERQN